MSYAAQTTRYVENDVLTRSAEWLVPLMYEHLLVHLRRTAVQIEAKDYEGRTESLSRASSIVGELLASLDRERGGEIAEGLFALYSYFAVELMNVSRDSGADRLPALIELVQELHEAWVEAAERISPRSGPRMAAASAA